MRACYLQEGQQKYGNGREEWGGEEPQRSPHEWRVNDPIAACLTVLLSQHRCCSILTLRNALFWTTHGRSDKSLGDSETLMDKWCIWGVIHPLICQSIGLGVEGDVRKWLEMKLGQEAEGPGRSWMPIMEIGLAPYILGKLCRFPHEADVRKMQGR